MGAACAETGRDVAVMAVSSGATSVATAHTGRLGLHSLSVSRQFIYNNLVPRYSEQPGYQRKWSGSESIGEQTTFGIIGVAGCSSRSSSSTGSSLIILA